MSFRSLGIKKNKKNQNKSDQTALKKTFTIFITLEGLQNYVSIDRH